MTFYDEEALYQDADLEQADLEREGRHIARLAAAGICTHGAWVGVSASGEVFYPEQEGLQPGQVRCSDCKRLFDTEDDLLDARKEVLS